MHTGSSRHTLHKILSQMDLRLSWAHCCQGTSTAPTLLLISYVLRVGLVPPCFTIQRSINDGISSWALAIHLWRTTHCKADTALNKRTMWCQCCMGFDAEWFRGSMSFRTNIPSPSSGKKLRSQKDIEFKTNSMQRRERTWHFLHSYLQIYRRVDTGILVTTRAGKPFRKFFLRRTNPERRSRTLRVRIPLGAWMFVSYVYMLCCPM
jgi:hypothetical protein